MTYTEWLDENWEKDNMFPPCLDAQKAVDFILNDKQEDLENENN